MSAYPIFLDALAQLEQDQSLYETDLGLSPELEGVQHEEIIKFGGRLCKRLQKFAEMGQTFAETLPPDFTSKLTDTIHTYRDLIVPPKIFGGFCPCLKPARSGPEYERKLLITKAKMHCSFFVCQAVIIENRGEKINMESMHYADYVNKMNTVFNGLADIKCRGSEKALENARKKLLVSLEAAEKFISNFGDSGGGNDFQAEARRRIRSTQELLISRQRESSDGSSSSAVMPVSKRVLIKAQSSMQEIMNSAAAIALTQAKDNLSSLESLQAALKKSRDLEVRTFNEMEDTMHEHGLMEELHRLREDSEVCHSDAASKLRDAVKRWTSIKTQAVPRKVAEYEEESEAMRSVSNVLPGDLNPTRFVGDAKKGIDLAGKNVGNVVINAKQDFQHFLGTGANMATSGVMGVKNIGTKAVKGVGTVFGIEGDDSSNSRAAATPPPKPPKTGFAKFNPLDMMSGSESDNNNGGKQHGGKNNGSSSNSGVGGSAQKKNGTSRGGGGGAAAGRGNGATPKKTNSISSAKSSNAVSSFLDQF